jgi:23S rRNA (guanosine2251-2'-O)-methyltransferase
VWIWGVHAAEAALANPLRRVSRVIATGNALDRLKAVLPALAEVQKLEPSAMSGMLPPGAVHQGLAVRAEPLEPLSLEALALPLDRRAILVLDQVTDPQNVGAAFRSAAAFGARGVVLQDRKAPPLTGALAKAAAGAIEFIPHARVVNIARAIESLAGFGYHTIALDADGASTIAQAMAVQAPPAIVLGAEGKGLRPGVMEVCAASAHIPIDPQMESLNVSVAAAIALYEANRGRG